MSGITMMKRIIMQDECKVWRALKYLLIHLIFVDGTVNIVETATSLKLGIE